MLNKQNLICSNILVNICVLCMHYQVSKDDFTLQSLLDLQTFKVFQGSYFSPIVNHVFDFWLAGKCFEPS